MVIFNKGFNYNQDGKGNRLVIHMQGCNFSCPWCSNPEGIPIIADGAKEIPDDDVVKLCENSKSLFFDGGGVTFSGGEPTLQFESLKIVLTALRERGISAAIETNGSHKRLRELFPYLDMLIIDCKHYDSDKHREYTGAGNEQTVSNIREAARQKVNTLVRIPLVSGFNASREDANGFAELLSECGHSVELLKYHEYGLAKRKSGEKAYRNRFVSDEIYSYFVEKMKENKINIVNT